MAKPLRLSFALPFEEAIAAAAARKIVLPEVYYSAAQKAARSITTTVSGLAGLDQITAVIASYREAAAKGEAFGTWKRMAELQNWGLPKGLLETIFRTQIQTEYSAGHWRSFEEHKVRRPYLMWSAINDSRVRPNHLALDGYIAPVGDPFWQTHPVPLGFRCRCTQISLTEAQSIARGYGRQATPTARPDKGFGEGNPGDAAAAVRRAADRKLTTAPPAARRAFDKFVAKEAAKRDAETTP